MQLYGLSLLLIFLGTGLGFLQNWLGVTSLSVNQWLLCVAVAAGFIIIDEVVKFFMRRGRNEPQGEKLTAAVAAGD
jgi:hypothetical protein